MKNVFIDPLRIVNFFGKFSKYVIVPLFVALFVSFFVSLFFHTAFSTDSNENNGFNIGDNTNNFLFLGYPQRTDDGRWRIRWNSIPGKTYELQRTVSRDLTNAEWTVVTNVKAAGSNTFVIDPLAFERSFYRVKTSDGVPPESDGSFFFDGDLDYFVALNSSGLPVEGARIPITSDGVLSPFEFRPSGRSTGGAGGVFYIRFPDGGRIVDLNGSITIEFTNAIAGFGRRCPFQLERPLSIKTNVTQRLDIDAPDVRSIVVAFGLSPTNGIDVILFGKFPFTIVSGIFDEEGLRGGRLVYRGLNFPLPEKSGDYPSFAVELMPKGGLRIPFSGEFKAPDGSDFGPTFRIPSHRPLWVEFKPNGDIGMGGRGELSFPNGMKFGVDFGFNEPHYFLSISASGVNIPLIDSLADFFPPPPQVPNQIDQINLDAARERLGVYNRAFLNFSTSLVGESPGGETTPSFLPSGFSATASSVLEAWGCAALCGATLEGGFLVTALKHAGMKSAAQPDLRVCISQYSSLLRIKKASSSGTLTIDLTVKNELDNAIGEALASVRSRARNTENIASLNNLFLIMSDLLEAEALRQELGMDLDGALYNALGGMLQRFCSDLTSRLGVQPGVFTPVSAHISNMNYYDAYEHVRLLIKTLDLAQQLGIESELNAPIEEAIGQLALRVWSELSDELDGAEARGDYAGFCNVLEDVLDFIELKQSGIFPEHPSLSNLPGAESIENFTARLDRVWQVEYEREYGYQGLGKVGKEMRRLVFILRRLSQSHAYPQSVVQKEFEKIQNSLDFAFDSLNSASLGELKDILSAGVSAKEFAERFNLSEAVSWENQRLPVLITRLANVAVTESGWSEIYESVQLLLSVSDCYRTNGNAMARLLYLKQAGMLAGAANQVAHQLAQSERVRRNANPGLQIADMVLPGDICVDRVAGSVKYNRLTREFGGVFSGQLRLPKHNLNLTVNNASFSSGGVFDLNASGAVEFPPFNPKGRLIIPEDRPLHISYQEDRQVRFSGAGRMELNNGMVFEVFLKLDDPLYQFNISARGIRFDAGDNLRVMVPTLPDGQTFSSEVARDLNEYFMSLSSTLDGVRENVGLPQVSPPGEPPQFSSPALIIPADSLAAWVDAQIADLRLNINRDYSATFGAVKANLKTIAGELRQRRGEILPEELKMRLTVLSKLCSIKERQQEVVNSPEFAEFLQETESAILELLQRALTKDESFRDNALEMVGQYKNVAGCYNPESSVKILAAIESYVKSQWLLFARTNGISETTGELVNPDLMPLTNYWIFYSRWKNYVRLVTEYNLLDLQSVSPEWIRKAGQTLAMRWRSAVLGELRRIDPTDSRDYTKLGFLTRDMSLILCGALENIFEYPSGNIEQLEGADRPYEYLNELRNTFLKRLQATAYVVTNANKFPIGEIVKYRFVSQPSSFVKAEDIRFVERFVCKLKLQADPVSQFIWQTLGPETQEILINYKPSNYLLTACDIISIYEFVETLSSPGHPPTDALSLYLWNRFSGGSQEIILTGGQDINKLLWTIANELNAIIKGPSIYNSTRFSGINLSSRTRNLLNANPQGNDLQKLNRWLLEDAYTNIVKSFDSPGTAQEQMKNTLAIHLDTLIHSGAIYTSERFAGVRLSVDTQERLATANQETVVLLNRRLLEDAYPEEIPPNDQQVMTLYVPALELLREPLENESNKCGGGDDWMTPAEREIIANADSIYAEAKLNSAEVLLLQTGTTGDLQGAIKLLKELIWFAGWAEEKQLPQAPKFAGCINRLTITFSILAEQQRAWWYLNEYTDILLDAAESGLLRNAPVVKNALIQEANNVLRTSAKLVESLSHLFPSLRPVDLPLPGKINIERIYGGISYNRSSEKIQGNFGGRIEFPDLQNAFFEISNAMLDNNLNFSIVASIGGPASGGPFHLPNGTRVTANINALGGPRQSFIFNGSGTLKLTNGPEFAVNVFYRTDPTVLEFNSVASNLKWELDKNFVIFDAGFGFQIRSDAQSGELNVRGSIGLFGNDFIPQDRPLAPEDFKLFIDRAEFYAGFHEDRIQITFSNGTLRLPESIFRAGVCPNAPTNAKPEIALSPLNPLQATLLFRGAHDEPELILSGDIVFKNIGITVPEIEGFGAELCEAHLVFSGSELPKFNRINGTVQIPLPPGQTNKVGIKNGEWGVNGYPSGTIALQSDLTLLDKGGAVFTLLGVDNPENTNCGCAFTLNPDGQSPRIRLDGAMKLKLPANMLTGETGDQVSVLFCGGVDWNPPAMPRADIERLMLEGTFRLGGTDGLVLSNGFIEGNNLQNMFTTMPNPPEPFTIVFGGTIFVPNGPGFGTRNMRFVFYNTNQINIHLPTFETGTFIYDAHNWELANSLPFQVSRAELKIKNGGLPPELLFRPDNFEMVISARLEIPPDEPVFKGAVNDLKVTFDPDGTPHLSVSSIRLGLDAGTALSPFSDIEGDLFIGGLNRTPPNPFFIGLVGGTYQTYKLKLLLAFSPLSGLIGVCMDANLGAAGIPLGQTGFLITGARGGYSFGNRFLDPCDFSSYFDPVTGKPVEIPGQGLPEVKMDWATLRDYLRKAAERAQAFNPTIPSRPLVRNSLSANQPAARNASPTTAVNEFGMPCPDGCPPSTVNIFCQPHPRQDKPQFAGSVILKFSSIDEPTLNNIFGITQERIGQLVGQGIDLAVALSQTIRQRLQSTLPVADPNIVGQAVAERLNYYVLENMNAVESGIYKMLTNALDVLEPEQKTAEILYPLIRDLVEIGLPCPDITVMAGGVLSYVGISAFANVQGDVIIGTPGSAGMVGTINVLGVPFGRAKLFVSVTDVKGNPNPSVCGDVNVSIGPLELGQLRAQILCDGCVTETLAAFGRFIICLSRETIDHLLNRVAPQYIGRSPQDLVLLLNDQQKMAFLSELAQLPPNLLPPNLKQIFVNALGEGWSKLNPEFRLCGEVKPKIFGISMGNELVGVSGHITRTNIIFAYGYSPAALIAVAMGYSAASFGVGYALNAFSLFTQEKAQAAFAVNWPDAASPVLAALEGKLRDPQSIVNYLDETFDYVTQNAVVTCEYRLSPMGIKAFDWQERYIMPNLTSHPAFRTNWVRPENRTPPLPSRMDLIISALTNHLHGTTAGLISDPNWKGRKNDLFLAFPEGSPERNAVTNCSFADDYFPHGGILGGSILGVPRALYDAPPEVLFKALDPNNSPLERILSALSYIQEYLLTMQTAGAFCYYIPAPNPPTLINTNTTPPSPLTPRELFKSIMEFDFDNIRPGNPYPSGEMFITGWFDGRLLGVPFGRARFEVVPPDLQLNQPAFFRATAEIPQNEWLSLFTDGGQLVFDITHCPRYTIEKTFTLLLQDLNNLLATNRNNETALRLAVDKVVSAISNDLPKIKLEAFLNNFHFPQILQPILEANGAFTLVAYSPGYNPYFDVENTAPFARAQRHGGIAFKGNTKFRAGTVTFWEGEAQFWVLPKQSGLPELSARFNAPVMPISELITLRDVLLDFSTEPNPHFIAGGKMDSFAIGTFRLINDNASDLEGRLEVATDAAGNPGVNLRIKPAQLLLDYYGNKLLVHGNTRNDEFTFNTTGNWSASLEFTNDINLLNIVEVGCGGFLAPIILNGNGVSSAMFTAGLSPGAGLTIFPNNTNLRRTFAIQSGTTGFLRLDSDGQFLLVAKMNSGEVGGFSIPAGASLVASNGGLSISWQTGTSVASIQISRDGGAPIFSGVAELPPIDLGFLRVEGADGGNLKGGFNNDGFVVESGARLTIKSLWGMNKSIALNSFTISNNGAILISASGSNNEILLAAYPFKISDFVFRRNPTNGGDGRASFTFNGNFQESAQNVGFPNAPFSGIITNGDLSITGSSPNTTFFGFPVSAYTNRLDLSSSESAGEFRVGFCLGNNNGVWTALGTNYMTGVFSSSGAANLSMKGSSITLNKWQLNNIVGHLRIARGETPEVYLEGDVQLQGLPTIRLAGRFGADFSYSLFPPPGAPRPVFSVFAQLDTDVNFRLNRDGLSASGKLHLSPLPEISLSGYFTNVNDFALEGSLNGALLGYSVSNGRIVLERIGNNPITLILTNCDLSVPGLASANVAKIAGGITNNGTFRFVGNLNAPKFAGLPVPGLSGNANVVFTHSGVQLSGNIDTTDGVLSKVSIQGSAAGTVSIESSGIKTVSAQVNVIPITNNFFCVYPASGGNFNATIDNSGLRLPQARLAFGAGGSEFANIPLPELVLDFNGDFIVNIGQDKPIDLTWRGFNLVQVSFRLQRIGQRINIPDFNGQIDIPYLGHLVRVNGYLNNDGTFELTGILPNQIDLSAIGVQLPVRSISANANVRFNTSGLQVSGNLSGGLLEVPESWAYGLLAITKDSIALSGNATLSPIVFGAVSIRSASENGAFTANLNNNGLTLPDGLQLKFNTDVLASLPSFNIDLNSNFQITMVNRDFTLAGFGISGAKIVLSRTNKIITVQITDANVNVPGFTTALGAKLSGCLSSDGSFRLETTSSLSGSFTPSNALLPFSNLSGNIRVALDQTGAIVSGTLSGGALDWLNSTSFSVEGALQISNSGVITPSATFTLDELQLPPGSATGFRLSPLSGGSFQINLNSSGISFPAGAQLFYRGQSLGVFMLPSFSINRGGDFSLTTSAGDFSLDGFNLKGTLNLVRSNGVIQLNVLSGNTIWVPGINASVNVSGTVRTDNSFDISGTLSGDKTFSGLAVTQIKNGAAVEFRRGKGATTLKLNGSLGGGVLSGTQASDIQLVNATGWVAVASSGSLSLGGSVEVKPFSVGCFTIEGNYATNGGSISASWVDQYLNLSGARLRILSGNVFDINFPLQPISIPLNGEFSISPVQQLNSKIKGFPFKNVGFILRRLPPNAAGLRDIRLTDLFGTLDFLNASELNKFLQYGTVLSDGTVDVNWNGLITLGGFGGTDAYVRLNNNVLTVGGKIDIRVLGRQLALIPFEGTADVNGNYSLSPRTDIDWILSNLTGSDSGNNLFATMGRSGGGLLTLTKSGISGSDKLVYGNLRVPISISGLTANGISFNGTYNYKNFVRFLDAPDPPPAPCISPQSPPAPSAENADVYGGLDVIVVINSNNSNGSFSVRYSGRFGWWVVTDSLETSCEQCNLFPSGTSTRCRWKPNLPPPFDNLPVGNITPNLSGGISSNGRVFINEKHGDQDGFEFYLW